MGVWMDGCMWVYVHEANVQMELPFHRMLCVLKNGDVCSSELMDPPLEIFRHDG